MPKLVHKLPSYRRHSTSGQAMVCVAGKRVYLGKYDSPESREAYNRVVAEWVAAGRRTVVPPRAADSAGDGDTIVAEVIAAFWDHAQVHYRKADGTPTSELDNMRQALRPLRRLYAHTSGGAFGPKALKAVREHMVSLGWCRPHINKQISRIKSVFRWAVENELVPANVHHSLSAVKGLQQGRTAAPEPEPVRPVPEEHVQAVRPFVSRQVWALVRLQLLTGARAGELIRLRPVDINTGGDVWTAEPADHKTSHRGHTRRLFFGPQAQGVLRDFLPGRPVDAYLFSPAEAAAEMRARRGAARRTPLSCGNVPGSNRTDHPRRRPKGRYTVRSYEQAIERALYRAFPPPEPLARQRVEGRRGTRWEDDAEWEARLGPARWAEVRAWRAAHHWHPHQLRHTAATNLRKAYGLEAAQVILGHKSLTVTQVYAEKNVEAARQIMADVG